MNAWWEPRTHWPPPDEIRARAERKEILDLCHAELSDENFEVLWLREVNGLTFVQIGEITGQTPDAAQKMHARTLDRMKVLLASVRFRFLRYEKWTGTPVWGYGFGEFGEQAGVRRLADIL